MNRGSSKKEIDMREWKSQSHVKWYCKYHIVFSPKYRKKAMFGSLRKGVGKTSGSCATNGGSRRGRYLIRNQEEEEKHLEQQNLRGL